MYRNMFHIASVIFQNVILCNEDNGLIMLFIASKSLPRLMVISKVYFFKLMKVVQNTTTQILLQSV